MLDFSELASFVAAILRDPAVGAMEQKMQELQRKLDYSQTIEIVQAGVNIDYGAAAVVYATALLQDGQLVNRCTEFEVPFTENTSCHPKELYRLWVRRGGVSEADFTDIFRDVCLEDDDSVIFSGQLGEDFHLRIKIDGWPREQWAPLLPLGRHGNYTDLFNFHLAASQHPEAKMEFLSITWPYHRLEGVYDSLPEPSRSRIVNELEVAVRLWKFQQYVAGRMKVYDHDGAMSYLHGYADTIIDALKELHVGDAENQSNKDLVDQVIQAHKEAQSTDNPAQTFQDHVKSIAPKTSAEDSHLA